MLTQDFASESDFILVQICTYSTQFLCFMLLTCFVFLPSLPSPRSDLTFRCNTLISVFAVYVSTQIPLGLV